MKIKPGKDTALLLAIMDYLVTRNKYNAKFIEEHGQGFDEFKEGIKDWSLEKAAKECDIPAAQIKEVAEMQAANAPNASIHPGRHVSWYGNDFQRQRSLACLTGLLGAYFVKGGWVPGKGKKIGNTSWAKKEHEIARRMGYEKDIPVQSVEELVEKDLSVANLDPGAIKAGRWHPYPRGERPLSNAGRF